MTVFDQPAGRAGAGRAPVPSAPVDVGPQRRRGSTSWAPTGPGTPDDLGCLTTTQLTVEISDVAAVGTSTEPLFQGAAGALVDVQIGQIGTAEGAPATWVMAQVGSKATSVQVQFADGTIDQAPVPSTGVVVLGHKGTALTRSGTALSQPSTCSEPADRASPPTGSAPRTLCRQDRERERELAGVRAVWVRPTPTKLPAPGAVQPADPDAATAAVTHAVATVLGCKASPVQRLQFVAGGDVLETVSSFAGSATVNVDKVVFTSATAAVVEYKLNSGQVSQPIGPLYAAATLSGGGWQLHAVVGRPPEIQVTPANQVGNVTVAPDGPLFVKQWPGGTAVAVYNALPARSRPRATGPVTRRAPRAVAWWRRSRPPMPLACSPRRCSPTTPPP